MGGAENLERQRAGGRLDARARVDALLDPGTFVELGALVGSVHRGVIDPGRRPTASSPATASSTAGRCSSAPRTSACSEARSGSAPPRSGGASSSSPPRSGCRSYCSSRARGSGARTRSSAAGARPNDLQALVATVRAACRTVGVVMGPSPATARSPHPCSTSWSWWRVPRCSRAGHRWSFEATGEEVDARSSAGPRSTPRSAGSRTTPLADDAAALALLRRYLGYFPSNAWQHAPIDAAGRRQRAAPGSTPWSTCCPPIPAAATTCGR